MQTAISIAIITLLTEAVDLDTVRRTQPALNALIATAIDPDEGDPLGLLRNAPCEITNISMCAHHFVVTDDVLATFTPEQLDWLHEGQYYQTVIFTDREHNKEANHDGGALALTMLDGFVCTHHSLDPAIHTPKLVAPELADHCEELIGDMYGDGEAIWNQSLVTLRNEFQIAVRAMATGDDVMRRLVEFRKSGAAYFLF